MLIVIFQLFYNIPFSTFYKVNLDRYMLVRYPRSFVQKLPRNLVDSLHCKLQAIYSMYNIFPQHFVDICVSLSWHANPCRYGPNQHEYKSLLTTIVDQQQNCSCHIPVIKCPRCFRQKEGVDFAPVSKYSTLRALMAVAAVEDMKVHQLDIKTAFLNGILEEEVYVEPPAGCHEGAADSGCHLHKALYGLRQAPRAWHTRLTEELTGMGFELYICGRPRPSLPEARQSSHLRAGLCR